MKKRILQINFILGLLFFSFQSQAQWNVGGGLSFGTEIESIGLNLRGQRNFIENIDGAFGLTYYLGANGLNQWALNADGHYHLTKKEKFEIYGLGGLNFSRISYDTNTFFGGVSNSKIGINVGAGAQLSVSDSLLGFGEIKYVLSSFDQLVLTAGVLFPIGS